MLQQVAWLLRELAAFIGNGVTVQFFASLTACSAIMMVSIPEESWRERVIAEDLLSAAVSDLAACVCCMYYISGVLDGFMTAGLILAAFLVQEENFRDWRKPRSYYEKDAGADGKKPDKPEGEE